MSKREKLIILGGGESGCGSAVLGVTKDYDVFLSDMGLIKPKHKKLLKKYNVNWEENKHSEDKILDSDIIVKSPGIPDNHDLILKAKKKNIPVISEIEFAGKFSGAKMICVSGSNGKTTTTMLIHHMLKKAGFNVGLAGNVGKSFALQVAEENYDYYVIELSSFQLDGMFDFKADISILLNITPDHLDRYNNNFNEYIDSKFRIIQNQGPNDLFVYYADDEVINKEIEKRKPSVQCIPFSLNKILENGAYLNNKEIVISTNNKKYIMLLEDLLLPGKHNVSNSMAAGITAKALDIRKEVIRESLSDFKGVEHRLELVIKVHGVEFINDSKATNINSTWFALESVKKPVVWIVGGVDKGNDYSDLYDLVKDKVKAIVCLGKDNTKIIDSFSNKVGDIVETGSMTEAVKTAYYLANKDETVLLSPACASFDLFDNYEDRGRQFKESVRNL